MAAQVFAFPTARRTAPTIGLRATLAARLAARLEAMWQARRTRMILAEMDQHQLADIGIGRGDALTEAARPFWDLAPRR